MANESNTELLVYDHFKKFEDKVSIEPKKSSNPSIDKLLQNASKKGKNKGYPEYIISFNQYPDLLIVIECKADNKKHQSNTPNFDKYAEYAVDGALLYASFLQKEYNVIAIGISGETKTNLKASHFLFLKEQKNYTNIFSDELLDVDSYVQGFLKSPEKFKQDYDSLVKYSKELNEDLQNKKVKESQRSLLISGIMIALDNVNFSKTYLNEITPKDLADSLVNTVIKQLKNAKIGENKLDNIKTAYSFIQTHTALSTEKGVLSTLITAINKKVNSFIRSHKYFDVLSEFYIEFLRKSNSDKGLGIVLTPHHITDLFNLIAGTNKESVVFDNCTGTSGFLVSAMRAMVKDAEGDLTKVDNIKQKQLIGIEYQDDIFALACSNMYLHEDGKTNLINGSCFDSENINRVKELKPNIGFLNPPYKANKKNDIDELEFVLNNLECLVPNGICVAIVPMSCALTQKGKILELKKRLLSKHTLEAVMSMPDELFLNSSVNVVSCIMVFKAHSPHNPNIKTYLGYWKDDGFVKRKHRGRFDGLNTWNKLKEEWILSYRNKDSKPEFCIMKNLTTKDEWCAEAFLETDLANLKEPLFVSNIKNHLAYCLQSPFQKNEIEILKNNYSNTKLELDTYNWSYFKYNDIFKINKGKRLTKEDQVEGTIPYVSSSSLNNGVDNYIKNGSTDESCLSFACYGSIGEVFYHKEKVWVSDNCNSIYLRNKTMNVYIGIFLSTIMRLEKLRFSYGMTAKKERLEGFKIKLPATKEGYVDYEFMENYIKSLPYSNSL